MQLRLDFNMFKFRCQKQHSFVIIGLVTELKDILNKVTKPARYTGGECNSIIKDWETADIRMVLAYPDVYEIGMSNLGLAILYHIINEEPYVLAERVYTPWIDMQEEMRRGSIPLFSLESKHPIKNFDIVGFSLGYELTYTNVLAMLDLAGIPVLSSQRGDGDPLIIAGGSCALNPEPMSDFIDLFILGDGEEAIIEFLRSFRDLKKGCKKGRNELLRHLAQIPGVYVPSLYNVVYNGDGTVAKIAACSDDVPKTVMRRMINRLTPIVTRPVVPYIATVHDRAIIETHRGCTRGCRFCHAGIIYRPVRERTRDEIVSAAAELIKNTGYNELSLLSLSTSDYSDIEAVIKDLTMRFKDNNLRISLPSLRLDSFSVSLMEVITTGRKTGLTFAPEAGSERLRRVINKNLSDEVIFKTLAAAYERGWSSIKLYFMLGLPLETDEDVECITELVKQVNTYSHQQGRGLNIKISASAFVPKPHTPFQWSGQISREKLDRRIDMLRRGLKRSGIHVSWQDSRVSHLEAVLSRGDRRLSKAIYQAWRLGAGFDAWREQFKYELWMQAFADCALEPCFYANRQRSLDEVFPWAHIDSGVDIEFLKHECSNSIKEAATEDCNFGRCNYCGLERLHPKCRMLL